MKKRFLLLFTALLSVSMLCQKKELREAERALKKNNFEVALKKLKTAESLIGDGDNKLLAKYYYIKGKSLYANGENTTKYGKAGELFNKLIDLEKKSKSKKYSNEADKILNTIVQKIVDEGSEAYERRDYKTAIKKFGLSYSLSKTDTLHLENVAMAAYFDKDYDKAISIYKKLLKMGYTGISKQYRAKSLISGEEVYFSSEKEMDRQVIMKVVENPEIILLESRAGTIAKNIALSYIAKGDEKLALEAIKEAKKMSPNDYGLIISEANIHFKLGNNEKFMEGLKKAIDINPKDPQLHYNVGVMTLEQGHSEQAISHFKEAIRLKPDYSDAYNNIGVAILEKTNPIIEEMNKNLSNFDKYDALLLKQKEVYREALPYYEKALEYDEKSPEIMRTLIGLYELLEMYDKQKETKSKLDSIQ